MFYPDDSCIYAINEALQQLDQPHLNAKVSHLQDGLVWVGQIKKQLSNLQWQEQLLS